MTIFLFLFHRNSVLILCSSLYLSEWLCCCFIVISKLPSVFFRALDWKREFHQCLNSIRGSHAYSTSIWNDVYMYTLTQVDHGVKDGRYIHTRVIPVTSHMAWPLTPYPGNVPQPEAAFCKLPHHVLYFVILLTGLGTSERKKNEKKLESLMTFFWAAGIVLAA